MKHGIDQPNLWHGNTLTKRATYSALFDMAPKTFMTNPPFGGKEGKDAQKNYAYATGSTQVLFVQDILGQLAPEGRCAIVLDDGFLFRKDEDAFVETKRKLVDECNLWAIISLPGGVFSGAGAAVKTNLLFFTKGRKTERIWYYDLAHVKVGKKSPITLAHFGFGKNGEVLDDADLPVALTDAWTEDENSSGEFPSYARLLQARGTPAAESRYSWTVDFATRRKQAREIMKPHLADAEAAKAEVVSLKEKLSRARLRLPSVRITTTTPSATASCPTGHPRGEWRRGGGLRGRTSIDQAVYRRDPRPSCRTGALIRLTRDQPGAAHELLLQTPQGQHSMALPVL
jgi:type I restriction enzyme M protein